MKKQIIITVALLMGIISEASAVDKYITDDAVVYLRRGPSTQYGFAGTVMTGEKVKLLEVDENRKFSKIEYANGRSAWIESENLNDGPALKEKAAALEAELAECKSKFDNLDGSKKSALDVYIQKLKMAEQQISDLTNERDALLKQVDSQNSKIEFMSIVVDEKQQSVIFKWFLYGGLIAGVGVILGLVLPDIITTRRKKRWMH